MLRRVFLCAVVVGCVFASDLTRAAIINGDFETGDLTGWSVEADPEASVAVQPIDGDFAAVLAGAPVGPRIDGLDSSYSLAILEQPLTLTEGATLAVDMALAYDLPVNYGQILTTIWVETLDHNTRHQLLQFYRESDNLHALQGSFSQVVSAVIPAAGDYTIVATISLLNPVIGDGNTTGALTVDNFRLLAVPEPSGLLLGVLAAIGALPLIGLRRRHSADSTQ